MRHYALILLFTTTLNFFSQQHSDLDVLVFSGTYQGNKVFVQNPFDREGVGFSVKHVQVNGSELTDQVFSSAFEIDLTKQNLKIGDSLSIHLYYNSEKQPKIINTGSLTRTNKNFELQLTDLKVENDSVLKWCFEGEEGSSEFIIEEYRWNRWIKIGEVQSTGTMEKSCYEFVVPELINGENKFRIVQFTSDDKKLMSKSVTKKSDINTVLINGNCKGSSFHFSRPTYFEIFDTYGNIVRKGFSDCPKFCGLQHGLYYINYGNVSGEVFNVKQKQACEDE